MSSFPNGFLWGAAGAGHQIEGGNVNADLWPQEWAPGSHFAIPSGDACDSYHRYGEDIALLADAGLNTYRFGIEWSRIEPEEGFYSRAALDHYRRMLAACHERGVTPIVTYNHFTTPRWFAASGGWSAAEAPDRFAKFSERATQHLGDLIPWVCTINEANIVSTLVHVGMAPAGHRDDQAAGDGASDGGPRNAEREAVEKLREGGDIDAGMSQVKSWPSYQVEVMGAAHRRAFDAIKSVNSDIQVGWTLALIDLQAVPGGEQRLEAGRKAAQLDWLDVSRDDDFIGVQTYTRERFGSDGLVGPPDGCDLTQTGWEVYPDALEHSIRLAAEQAGVPIIVTENGMGTSDDRARIAYTQAALAGMERCIADGIDVRGYTHWTLLDNWEWTSGFAMTFGLIEVDLETFARTPKPSLAWLGAVAVSNGLPS